MYVYSDNHCCVYTHIIFHEHIERWVHWVQFWNPGPPLPFHKGTVADWVYEMWRRLQSEPPSRVTYGSLDWKGGVQIETRSGAPHLPACCN